MPKRCMLRCLARGADCCYFPIFVHSRNARILMLKKLFYLLLLIGLSSCHVLRPSLMLKTPKNYKYDTLPKMPEVAYKISANDILEFKMYSNDGFKLIDMTTLEGSTVSNASIRRGFEYHVAYDGTVKLPVLGIVPVKG